MRIVALDGFGAPCTSNIGKDLAEFAPLVVPAPRWGNNWKPGDAEKIRGHISGNVPCVVVSFSDGGCVALELCEYLGPWCEGLIFISGLEAKPTKLRGFWKDVPSLCLCTHGEKKKLQDGTANTFLHLTGAGSDATFHRSPRPPRRWFPHLAGIGHHLPEIRLWLNKHFNHGVSK